MKSIIEIEFYFGTGRKTRHNDLNWCVMQESYISLLEMDRIYKSEQGA